MKLGLLETAPSRTGMSTIFPVKVTRQGAATYSHNEAKYT